MRENLIRALFSLLAAAVVLSMSQEWFSWAFEQHRPWKLLPALILAAFAVFEARQVWRRGETLMGISHAHD